MSIDSKKIFWDTPTEWHDRTQTNPFDYTGVGVHVTAVKIDDPLNEFSMKVPAEAEVVVNYRVVAGNNVAYASGTALVPKGTKTSEKK